jgi:effector-binding domain-containing protein
MKKTFFITLVCISLLWAAFALTFPGMAGQGGSVSIKQVTPFVYCCITHKGSFSEIQNVMGQLMMSSQAQNIFPAGPPFGVYYIDPDEVKPEELVWEVGFPIMAQSVPRAPLEKKQWTYTVVATAQHTGPYEKAGETITKILEWMTANDYVQAGPILERYLTMPTPTTKPSDLKSEIWIPCTQK